MRRAVVLVMVEPPDNNGRLQEWQWPQARSVVIASPEEEAIIPDAIANEARVAAKKCIALADREDKPQKCGCGHPTHFGLVCGWPWLVDGHRMTCECEA
jgi:hypothetical protein